MRIAISNKVTRLEGNVHVAPDKSISHRALMLLAISSGVGVIKNILKSKDVLNTMQALELLGVRFDEARDGSVTVYGVGLRGLCEPKDLLYMGNSGTSTRLLMGLLAPYNYTCFFSGDKSLNSRPMKKVMEPLEEMGSVFFCSTKNTLPVAMKGSSNLVPIKYSMKKPSAQIKSAILLATLPIVGTTVITEKSPSRDHTELMLEYLGANIKVQERENGTKEITLSGAKDLSAKDISVPADPSSSAFLVVAALIIKGSKVTVRDVCINKYRVGIYDVLKQMGAKITFINEHVKDFERVADIEAEYSQLEGVEVDASVAPRMIDEYPILAIAASCANGKTIMRGLSELRVKESDRLQAISDGLNMCGIKAAIDGDDLIVDGAGNAMKCGVNPVRASGVINTKMDHRIAMSFLVMGMISRDAIKVDDYTMIETSFPRFTEIFNSLGAKIVVK